MNTVMTISKKELVDAIAKVKDIVPSKTTMPVLQSVLVENGYLIANDTESSASVKLDVQNEAPFIIPSRAFQLLNAYPDELIEISVDDKQIQFKSGRVKNTFAVLDPEQFVRPNIVKENLTKTISIPAETFIESCQRVSFAISDENSNKVMTALCLKASGGYLNYVGLDGHMVAWDRIKERDGDFELLIPKKIITQLRKFDYKGDIEIAYNAQGVLFYKNDYQVTSRLIEGKYFDVSKMKQEGRLYTIINKDIFAEALNRIVICMSKEEKKPVILRFDGDELHLGMKTTMSDASETVSMITDIEEPFEIGFNPNLLLKMLKSFDCDEVRLNLISPKAPMMIENTETDYLALLLPVNYSGVANNG